jgi:hypothetical protein
LAGPNSSFVDEETIMETWTVTVTDAHGGIRYAVEVDIEPEHSDAHDGPEAVIAAYNQIGG